MSAGAGVVVLGVGAGAVSWLNTRLRRAAALVGRWYRCRRCQLAVHSVETEYRRWCQLVARAACTLYSLVPATSRMSCDSAQLYGSLWVYAGVIENRGYKSPHLTRQGSKM